jgi:hypothetical protein
METPLATYTERRLIGTRTFRLFPSTLELIGRQGSVRYDLSHLLPSPKTGTTIDSAEKQWLWTAVLAMFFVYLLVPATQPEFIALLRRQLSPIVFLAAKGVYLVAMITLLALAVLRAKKYEFVSFEYDIREPRLSRTEHRQVRGGV